MNTTGTDVSVDLTQTHATQPAATQPAAVRSAPVRTRDASIRRQPWHRLVGVEIRKSVDTRSGVAVVLLGLAVIAVAVGYALIKGTAPTWGNYSMSTLILGVTVPLIGLFAMTAEWTQRTALTTFLLSPRRGRVLAAKFVSALLLAWAVLAAVVAVIALAVVAGAALHGGTADWSGMGDSIRGLYILTTLQVIMAAGFGALIAQTAVAVGAFLVAPTIWTIVGPLVFGDNALWLDVFAAQARLMSNSPTEMLPQTLVAIGVWIVLPATVGVVRSLRREVK